jgi:hypothetical protein
MSMGHLWNDNWQWKVLKKDCSSATLSTTNFTWTIRDWTWASAVRRLLTKYLSYGTATAGSSVSIYLTNIQTHTSVFISMPSQFTLWSSVASPNSKIVATLHYRGSNTANSGHMVQKCVLSFTTWTPRCEFESYSRNGYMSARLYCPTRVEASWQRNAHPRFLPNA